MANTGRLLLVVDPVSKIDTYYLLGKITQQVANHSYLKNLHVGYCSAHLLLADIDRLTPMEVLQFLGGSIPAGVKAFVVDATYGDVWEEATVKDTQQTTEELQPTEPPFIRNRDWARVYFPVPELFTALRENRLPTYVQTVLRPRYGELSYFYTLVDEVVRSVMACVVAELESAVQGSELAVLIDPSNLDLYQRLAESRTQREVQRPSYWCAEKRPSRGE